MRPSSGFFSNHCKGFSLLEFIVVLAILSIALTAGSAIIRGSSDVARLNLVTQRFSSLFQEARLHAIERNRIVPISFETSKDRIVGPTPRLSLQLDRDLSIRFIGARLSQQRAGVGRLRFFPDGSSTGGNITLSLNNHVSQLTIDWMTGAVRSVND